MKKVRSNKLDVAQKAVERMNGVNIPSEVLKSEAKLFHVALIDTKANKATLEFEHTLMIKKFNFESFQKSKEMYTRLGYGKMVIFHDPTLPYEDLEEEDSKTETTGSEEKLTVKDLEKVIQQYSVVELEDMLETEERVGAIKLIQERLEFLTNEEA